MTVDENVLVNCPLYGFALRKAVKCFECRYYSGLSMPEDVEDVTQVQVVCAKPLTRRLIKMVDE